MNILIVGSQKEWAFENHYMTHLNKMGADVSCFAAHDVFYNYYYCNIINKLIFRLGLSDIYRRINRQLIELVKKNTYDIIWVFKGMEIYPETLSTIRKQGIKLVNLNPDHPFIHTFRGSGNNNVLGSIGCFDLHLCYNLPVKARIEQEYGIACHWLPFGYEESEVIVTDEETEKMRACFIGNPDNYRALQLMKIIQAGIPLDVYGNDWDKWLKVDAQVDVNIHPPIYKSDFNKVATQYRVQLNIFRPHNDNSHNMRTFEMPGLACIMVAPDSEEHRQLFKDGEEAFFYQSSEEMIQKTKWALHLDYQTALEIRLAAQKRSVSSGYSYQSRAQQVLSVFNKLING